jgi:polyferredoxin
LALLAGTIAGIALRKPLLVDVIRDQRLYRIEADGRIANAYTLRLVNKTNAPQQFQIRIKPNKGITLSNSPVIIQALPEQVVTLPVTLSAAPESVTGRRDVYFEIRVEGSALTITEESRFFGPLP